MDFLLGYRDDLRTFFLEGSIALQGKDSKCSPSPSLLNVEPVQKAHFHATTQKYLCSYCLSHVPAHELRGGYSPKLAHLQ